MLQVPKVSKSMATFLLLSAYILHVKIFGGLDRVNQAHQHMSDNMREGGMSYPLLSNVTSWGGKDYIQVIQIEETVRAAGSIIF